MGFLIVCKMIVRDGGFSVPDFLVKELGSFQSHFEFFHTDGHQQESHA